MTTCHECPIRRFTPTVSRRTRLFLAAFLWSAVGTGLLFAGVHWLWGTDNHLWLALFPVAAAIGWAKGRFVLGSRAEANAQRILETTDARCVGGIFSWGSWFLAVGMVALGITLRHSALPRPWLGLLYSAIGTALLTASLRAWRYAGSNPP
ncbi:MAG: hypothetical protein V1495_09350 [Pseudomonadota bacterium]